MVVGVICGGSKYLERDIYTLKMCRANLEKKIYEKWQGNQSIICKS